jgi:hypothetical protein
LTWSTRRVGVGRGQEVRLPDDEEQAEGRHDPRPAPAQPVGGLRGIFMFHFESLFCNL